MPDSTQLHATCISLGGKGVLLLGPSGSGKSDLALRLIDGGAMLVGDDQIVIHIKDGHLFASPAERLHGLLEVRSIGIMDMPYAQDVPVALAIKLAPREEMERMPHPQFFDCLGLQVPLHSFHAFDHSTPAKIRLLLRE